MKYSTFFHPSGHLRLRYRRLLFWLTVAALAAVVVLLVTAKARAAYAAYSSHSNPVAMNSDNEITGTPGLTKGATYEAKTPASAAGPTGTLHYNDRRITGLKQVGPGPLDYEVDYVTPASPKNAQTTTATEFWAFTGRDVSEFIAPGLEWRPYTQNQPAAQPVAPAISAELASAKLTQPATAENVPNGPGAGEAPTLRQRAQGRTEATETGNTASVTAAPAQGPNTTQLATANQAVANAEADPGNKSVEPDARPATQHPAPQNTDMAANSESLKDKALRH